MANQSLSHNPSETAQMAALRRELANKAYPDTPFGSDNLATAFLPPHFRFFLKFRSVRQNTADKLEAGLPGLQAYMIARTRFFDDLFTQALQDHTPQIVLLGAGYDTRAYRFAALNHGTHIFELDSPPTQNRKIKCLKHGHVQIPEAVTFVPVNFNDQPTAEVLAQAGFREDQKTLFLWEGVTYYLEASSVDQMIAFVCQTHSESLLAFDYTVTVTEETMNNYFGAKGFYQAMQQHHGGEALTFSLPEGTVDSFLEQRGLRVIRRLNNAAIEAEYLQREDGSTLGPMTGHFRFVVAKPVLESR
ncbi:MAG: SAM-dependent methyltransferase [Anaerolineales bacterium]|nr:SAM-dependent methyltransferase [Anaerolineales bacterium]